jgi:ParB family transcriptional regulator, chromosome partitioning protein
MDSKRILIVEPDSSFALSLAALFRDQGQSTGVAASAAEAEREMSARRPQLLVLRAELPDLSGFSLCARLRHDPEWAQLPIILFSSETSQEVLSDHARTPTAASGYFGMPLDTHALTGLARQLLADGEPDELEDDELIEIVEEAPVEVRIGEEPQPEEVATAQEEPVPPPVPQRPQRTSITDEDRLFVDRVFQSISERQADLMAESHRRRPPPRRDLLATPEGRLQLVREDLRWREAQIARLSEIWGARERQLEGIDDRLHERDVQIQVLKLQVEDLLRRLGEARDLFLEKEREHGASLEGLLLEKFSQEKELIEVVAASERRIHELEREIRARQDDLAHRKIALDAASEEIARLERESQAEAVRAEEREKELEATLAGRGAELAAVEGSLVESRQSQAEAQRIHDERTAAAEAAHRALEQELAKSRSQNEEAVRAFEQQIADAEERARAVQAQLDESRTSAAEALARSEARSADLQQALTALEAERDHLLAQAQVTSQAYQARIDEREAAIRERENQLRLRDEEHRRAREEGRAREEKLNRQEAEAKARSDQVAEMERTLEQAQAARSQTERELRARVIAAEAQAAEVNQRLERMLEERRDLEIRQLQTLDEVRARQADEAQAREQSLAEEIEHLRRLLQERARQAKLLEVEAQRLRGQPPDLRGKAERAAEPDPRAVSGDLPEK